MKSPILGLDHNKVRIGFIYSSTARKAAERYFKELERLNIIKPEKIGKEVLYINIELLSILSGK